MLYIAIKAHTHYGSGSVTVSLKVNGNRFTEETARQLGWNIRYRNDGFTNFVEVGVPGRPGRWFLDGVVEYNYSAYPGRKLHFEGSGVEFLRAMAEMNRENRRYSHARRNDGDPLAEPGNYLVRRTGRFGRARTEGRQLVLRAIKRRLAKRGWEVIDDRIARRPIKERGPDGVVRVVKYEMDELRFMSV